MVGTVLNLDDLLTKETLACGISNKFHEWNILRQKKLQDAAEVRKYVYQTDTSQTTNVKLPWKNKTTTPKLCQIRDNLYANYMQSMFPKRRWLKWEGDSKEAATAQKKKAIEAYTMWMIDRPQYRNEISKLVYDFIDYGNAFAFVDWIDQRNETDTKLQSGYAGPILRRISPDDIVFNPIAPSFAETPKIIRSLISLGEVKKILERFSAKEDNDDYQKLFDYLIGIRQNKNLSSYSPDLKDSFYQMDGFSSYRAYLESGYCEILTFYGDYYDIQGNKFYQNHEIMIVDRHKIIRARESDSYSGVPQVYHTGWRLRQDNLWAMGPLDNLVGLQYRIDHLENCKADLWDLTAFPPLHIKGYVEDFEWGPFARIVTDADGDVKPLWAEGNPLNANLEIGYLAQTMEELAGSPKEAMGFRTPGEKTAYEVQKLESAAGRIFTSKIIQFEEQIVEESLNGMVELGRRRMDSTTIRVFDDEFNLEVFMTLTPDDLTGQGRIRPIAARHFAETADRVQNLTTFAASPLYQDPAVNVHVSGLQIATLVEELLDIEQYDIVEPWIRLSEQSEAQKFANVAEEGAAAQTMTPSGLTPEDTDEGFTGGA